MARFHCLSISKKKVIVCCWPAKELQIKRSSGSFRQQMSENKSKSAPRKYCFPYNVNLNFEHVLTNLGKFWEILGFYYFKAWEFVKSRVATQMLMLRKNDALQYRHSHW